MKGGIKAGFSNWSWCLRRESRLALGRAAAGQGESLAQFVETAVRERLARLGGEPLPACPLARLKRLVATLRARLDGGGGVEAGRRQPSAVSSEGGR